MRKMIALIIGLCFVSIAYAIPASQDSTNIAFYTKMSKNINGTYLETWNNYVMDDKKEWESSDDYLNRISKNLPNKLFYASVNITPHEYKNGYYPLMYYEYNADIETMKVGYPAAQLWNDERFFVISLKSEDIPIKSYYKNGYNIKKSKEIYYCLLPTAIESHYIFDLPKEVMKNSNLKVGFLFTLAFKSQRYTHYVNPVPGYLFEIEKIYHLLNVNVKNVFVFDGNTGKIYFAHFIDYELESEVKPEDRS